jgi:hypothetical protein
MRIQSWMLFLACAGCLGEESVYEQDGAIDEDLSADMTEVDMPVAVEAAGVHRLMSTDFNLHIFRDGCYHDHKLDWSCGSNVDGSDAHFTHKREVGSDDTQTADNGGNLWGECVSLVKAATKSNVVTGDWRPGAGVFAGLPRGTAIATFPGGHYSGHTAILLGYVKQSGSIIGIRVADQNWLGANVKRHIIRKGGSGVSNASNYSAVLVP